jgi:hypothetical protein
VTDDGLDGGAVERGEGLRDELLGVLAAVGLERDPVDAVRDVGEKPCGGSATQRTRTVPPAACAKRPAQASAARLSGDPS